MSGEIIHIFTAAEEGADMVANNSVEVVADKGIVGDRYFGVAADESISLIEAEQVDQFNASHGTDFAYSDIRRSLVTRGVDLNGLVGKTFTVGRLRVYGCELCEPCSYLASRTTQAVLRGLLHRGGLRGRILDSGTLSVGDKIVIHEVATVVEPA